MIQALQLAFDFSAEDLRANRRGELSGRQLKRLQTVRGFALLPLLLLTGVAVVVSGTLLFAGFLLVFANVSESGQGLRSLFVIACIAAPAIGLALLIGYRWLIIRYLRNNRVIVQSGRFKLYDNEGIVGGSSIAINKRTFTLSKLQTAALRPYRQHQIKLYCLKDSQKILSVDVLL